MGAEVEGWEAEGAERGQGGRLVGDLRALHPGQAHSPDWEAGPPSPLGLQQAGRALRPGGSPAGPLQGAAEHPGSYEEARVVDWGKEASPSSGQILHGLSSSFSASPAAADGPRA